MGLRELAKAIRVLSSLLELMLSLLLLQLPNKDSSASNLLNDKATRSLCEPRANE